MMNRLMTAVGTLCATGMLLTAASASAHVGLTSPVAAGSKAVMTFGVAHGCDPTHDSVKIEIAIPETVTSVRPLPSAWGDAEITLNDANLPTAVTWSKPDARPADDQYYEFQLYVGVPDEPFTELLFKTTQTCRDSEGTEVVVEWNATHEEHEQNSDLEPAPHTVILPAHMAGWNKFKAPVEISEMEMFEDAQIVWVGDKAYSANEATMAMIEADDAVELLESIPSGTNFWVKY